MKKYWFYTGVSFALLFISVALPIHTRASSTQRSTHILNQYVIYPLSDIFLPLFLPDQDQVASVLNQNKEQKQKEKTEEKKETNTVQIQKPTSKPTLTPKPLTKEEILSLINQTLSVYPKQTNIQYITNSYSRGGGTEGLANSIAQSIEKLSQNATFTAPNITGGISGDSATFTGPISASYFAATSVSATSTFAGGLAVQTSKLVVDRSTGYVGIGSTTPWGLLSVNANGLTAGTPQFVVGSSTATNFIVANNGNVGIGTSTPTQKLEVVGNIQISNGNSFILTRGTGTNRDVSFYNPSQYDNIASLNIYPTSGTNVKANLMVIPKGTGYNSTNKADIIIGNTDYVSDPNNYEWLALRTRGSDYAIYSEYAGTGQKRPINIDASNGALPNGQLYLATSGNVGISTTTPWRTMSVNGTVAMPSLVNDSTGYYVCLNTTTGQLATSSTACGASSQKYKENITDLTYGLKELLKLRPVSFTYKPDYSKDTSKQLGFIAEEVDQVVPELVAKDQNGQIQGLDYPKFSSLIVKSMQEMEGRVAKIESAQASGTPSITYEDGIIDTITFFGGQIAHGVAHFTQVFADKVTAPTVQTDKLCVGSTCISEAELKIILEKSGTASVGTAKIEIISPMPQAPSTTTQNENNIDTGSNSLNNTSNTENSATESVSGDPTTPTSSESNGGIMQ